MENNLSIKICGINNKETAKVVMMLTMLDSFFIKSQQDLLQHFRQKKFLNFFPKQQKKLVFLLMLILI